MNLLKEQLIEKLMHGRLPGKKAQYQMAPSDRQEKERATTGECRNSAVAIIIWKYENDWKVLLSKRQANLSHHAGQVSFIGGEYDNNDKSLINTALREVEEEIGIKLHEQEMIRMLTPLFIPTSRYKVYPFVFVVDRLLHFQINNQEVERLMIVPLAKILTIKPQKKIEKSSVEIPYFPLDGETVWGATAMILNELIFTILNDD